MPVSSPAAQPVSDTAGRDLLPDVLVIGAPRSGTTSLYRYLGQHPQVFMSPVKEARFFAFEGVPPDFQGPADARSINRNTVTTLFGYQALFREQKDEQLAGEASPIYLYYGDRAAPRIQQHVPEVKLVAILRDPVERAYSDFLNTVRLGWEPLHDFREALEAEEHRIQAGWSPFYHYRAKGFYYQQVKRYTERFDASQLRIYRYERLRADADGLMRDLFEFLGIQPVPNLDTGTRHNRSGLPRSRALHRLLTHPVAERLFRGPARRLREHWRDANLTATKPPLDPALRAELTAGYREDILKLQDLLDWDLTAWLHDE